MRPEEATMHRMVRYGERGDRARADVAVGAAETDDRRK
jgi:hypothetical protein